MQKIILVIRRDRNIGTSCLLRFERSRISGEGHDPRSSQGAQSV